ncbi:MAG: right-handed parallel beta-helix repeat-containing protein, partial [Planctomycetales bacterium]|nr:right-handed parallel beta-helix repeat-containing protein [Planctomycetales bacterium]
MLVSSLRRACSVRASSLEALEDRRLLTEVGGTLASDTVWSVNGSPYEVVRDIVIPEGVKLTIAPGARLRFSPNTGIQVQGGQLLADGSPWQRIIFEPATANAWDGLRFSESLADNRISFADMIRGDGQGEAIQVTESRLHLDNIEWSGTNGTILELEHPSLIVRNSHFPQSSSGEVIHGTYIEGSEYLIIDGNVFEKSDSGDDVIDILGADRPGPVMQILNNVFKGGGDDGLDLDGTDAHVEGNLFMNFQKNTGRATTSNAIATGLPQSGEDNRTQVTIVRNIFVDNDHAILLKEDAFATIENNVFVGMREAVIQFNEVGGTSVRGPGKGAALDGNIFAGNASLFRNLVADDTFRTELTVMHSLIPNESISFGGVQVMTHSLGEGNIEGDPGFVDAANGNYRLLPQSPAIGRGKAGINMGAYVDTMPVITPMEREDLTDNDALFYVAGPSVASYRYRLNDQQYGPLTDATQPIELLDIENDQYSLDVIAMDSAGEWIRQSSPAFGEKIAHIIAPSSAWQGEILPAVVRVYDHAGKINSNFSTPAELDTFGLNETALKIKKGVGTLTSTVTAASDFQLAVPNELRLLAAPGGMIDGQEPRFSKRITLLHDGSLTTEHSGMLSGDEMWNAESEHHVTGDLTITPGTTLTIEAGARVVLATQTNVRVEGKLIVNGSDSEPVLFNALVPNQPWGGIRIVDGEANINYTFFTQGGGDTSQEFGHSNSQPVLRADNSRLTCDNCFLIDNVGKGFASTSDSVVSIQNSIISNADTGGEFANSQVTVTNTYVKDIPNDDGIFQDDDNDGFYFSGVHSSGAPSRFVDSFVIDTKDDGLDHNGAELIVERAWIEGTLHEGLASSNKNTATVVDSVFRYTNQGVEAGYGAPDLQIRNSVVVDTNAQADPDSPINAGVRFGDGYDGSNGSYRG